MSVFLDINQPKYSKQKPEVIVYDNDLVYDLGKYAYSIYIQNSIETGTIGAATIAFAPSNNPYINITNNKALLQLKEKLIERALISIKLNADSDEYDFFGIINNVDEIEVHENNNTSLMLNVSAGLALPTLLFRDSLPASYILQNEPEIEKQYGVLRTQYLTWMRGNIWEVGKDGKSKAAGNVFANFKPDEAIKYILQNASAVEVYEKMLSLKSENQDSLWKKEEVFTGDPLINIKTLDVDMLFDATLTTYTGNVFDYLKSCIDEDFYELYFETATTKDTNSPRNKLVIRPKPFSLKYLDSSSDSDYSGNLDYNWSYWEDLPTIVCYDKYITKKNLSLNDFESYNFFNVLLANNFLVGASDSTGIIGAKFPIVDIPSTKKYGFRELSKQTKMIDLRTHGQIWDSTNNVSKLIAKKFDGDYYEGLVKKRDRIVEWYNYPRFETGNIIAIYNSIYKIGRKLLIADRPFYDIYTKNNYTGMVYYIDSVIHQYTAGEVPKTTIGLTRGQPSEKDFLGKWIMNNKQNLFKVPIFAENKLPKKNEPEKKEEIKTSVAIQESMEPIK